MYNILINFGRRSLDAYETYILAREAYSALGSVKELWSKEFKETYSIKFRIAIFLFYALHISLLIMANALVVYLLGEFLLSASLASLLVNFTTIANSMFEHLHEFYQNYTRKREREKLKSELGILDINFEQNSILLKDFVEQNSEIDALQAQQSELVILLSYLESEDVELSEHYISQLENIAETIRAKCDAITNEQMVIDAFYQKHDFDVDEQKIICDTNIEIKLIQEHKKEIRLAISDLKLQRNYDGNPEAILYENHLKSLDTRVQECAIINQHFYKLLKSKNVLTEVEQQIANLDQKYLAAPYIHYDAAERNQRKKIELDYLNERRTALTNFIRQPVQPKSTTRNQAKFDIRYNASEGLRSLEERKNKATLKNILNSQIATLEHLLVEANKEFERKKVFLQSITADPKSDIKHDFEKIATILNKINKIDGEIKLSNEQERHKLWSTYISMVAASVAILTSYFSYHINSDIVDGISKTFTIIGEGAAFNARKEIRKAKENQQREEKEEASIIKFNLHSRAENLFDPELRESCIWISQDLERNYPVGEQALSRSRDYLPRASQMSSPRNRSKAAAPRAKSSPHNAKRAF